MTNRVLGRTGSFWQREYFDRLIRNENELEWAVVQYVITNPERARLKGWPWVWCVAPVPRPAVLAASKPPE
jgi:putative transposase